MIDDATIKEIIPNLIPTALTLSGILSGGWWFKRWVGKTDAAVTALRTSFSREIRSLNSEIQDLKLKVGIAEGTKTFIQGQLTQIQTAIESTQKSLGRTEASLEKAWSVLQREFCPSRMSDDRENGS